MAEPFLDAGQITRLNDVLREVSEESDRATAILLSAEIDAVLGALIEASFLPASSRDDRLLRPDGPLGTFAARIEVAFRLGIISEALRRDLDFIRRIRNEFAHKPAGLSFGDARVASYARELHIASWIVKHRVDLPFKLDSPRNRFTLSGAAALALISGLVTRASRPEQKSPEFGYLEATA